MTLADSLRHVVALKDSLLEAALRTRDSLATDTSGAVGPENTTNPAVTPWSMLASAFFGAFFAFLFTQVAEWLAARRSHAKRHRDALVRLERLCQDYLNEIAANKTLTAGAVKAMDAAVPYWSFPHPFAIETSFTDERQLELPPDDN